ncbi:hypothetical protein BROUX41_006610 [Berkeleyomyces rouxiae]|uniref:uncharacterized protein n=1 Tax=Berkeleyomyces rouxiae TaxID=2035830 RepID=UPI003B7E3C7A
MASASSSCPSAASAQAFPVFAEGQDASALRADVQKLLSESSGGQGKWALSGDGAGLERTFKFKTFAKTWDFMTAVSLQCKQHNHHPEWSNVYNTVFIRWTTHVPRGLTDKDKQLAGVCDELAQAFGEVPGQTQAAGDGGGACELRDVAGRAVQSAGPECCMPKTKKTV